MATNPRMDGSSAARTRSILTRLTELQTSIDAVSAPNTKAVAKAWVSYLQATPEILDSYGVDSVTDSSTGLWVVNFTTAFANNDYAVVTATNINLGTAGYNTMINGDVGRTTTTLPLATLATTLSGTLADGTQDGACVVCFGDQ